MSLIKFPPNPSHGTIFEVVPGLFYQYDAKSNCWNRLEGLDALGLATPLSDGLMPSEDYRKLQSLLVPPPQTTLQGEDCRTAFTGGTVGLYSLDGSLEISSSPKAINRVGSIVADGTQPWHLHRNTAGFDFRVPIEQLLLEIENRGLLNKVRIQGDKGEKGPRGEPGRDRLDTGPVGDSGSVGQNSPFDGSLLPEDIPFEKVDQTSNRAIVDVTVEQVSESENYLVATRANVGNPDACPSTVVPKGFDSELLLVINTQAGGKFVRNQVIKAGDCSLICRICSSSVHHLNIEPILTALFEKFKDRVSRLKQEKEALVQAWLRVMIDMFTEQKAALCCALENCRSRNRNERTRQYIETQRIQAALGDFKLKIDPRDGRTTLDMDASKNCPVTTTSDNGVVFTDTGAILTLDSEIHIVDPRTGNTNQSLTVFLPAGTYVAEITGCCANFNQSAGGDQFSGRAALGYQARIAVEDTSGLQQQIESKVITFPDFGVHATLSSARNAYQGVTVTFEHAGGNISAWLLDPDGFVQNNNGIVQITITNAVALAGSAPPSADVVYVYRNEITPDNYIGRVSPYTGLLTVAENLGVGTGNSEVSLTSGPPLNPERVSLFLYDGADGLHLCLVAGEPGTGDTIEASLDVRVEILSNPLVARVSAADSDSDVKKISGSEFLASMEISSDSAGFAIGEIDPNADYAVAVDPLNLDLMRSLYVWDADGSSIVLAEAGSEGLGAQSASVEGGRSALLFDISNVPDGFGGGNQYGLLADNYLAGQNVVITRPVDVNVPDTVGGTVDPTQPVPLGQPPVDQSQSALPRGTTGSPLDPNLANVILSVFANTVLAVRYILTNEAGEKFYSDYAHIQPNQVGQWVELSLGSPTSVLAPPALFTGTVIQTKTIDTSLLTSLSKKQLKIAESLEGISRLSYVQSLLGTAINKSCDMRLVTDVELEILNMPINSIAFGSLMAVVGLSGATTQIPIDDFEIVTAAGEDIPLGRIKRVVANAAGSDSTTGGLLFTGLTNYYADYTGFDTFFKVGIDFNGNNFFTVNREGTDSIVQISERGFRSLVANNATPLRTSSGEFSGDSIVVSDFGAVYVADGPAGVVGVYTAANVAIRNALSGDANDGGANSFTPLAINLPKVPKASIVLGRRRISGGTIYDELIVNFGDQWYQLNGVGAVLSAVSGAARVDTTTPRCCGSPTGNPGPGRMVLYAPTANAPVPLAAGSAGNSLATDRDVGPQPSIPFPSVYATAASDQQIQAELDAAFNQFSVYSLDGNRIYRVDPTTGIRDLIRELPENGFGLRVHPITKDFYYIIDDRGSSPIPSGTRIKRVDISDLDSNGLARVETVYAAENNEGIFGIVFGNTLPAAPGLDQIALYVLLSTLTSANSGQNIAVRLVEVSESSVPSAGPVPTNSLWTVSGTGGRLTVGGNLNRIVFSKIAPGAGCQMHYKQVQWYERGWRIGACCGALVQHDGTYYIVVKRSMGIDISCGGGESDTTRCIQQYIDSGEGHPAIAWPTLPPEDSPPGGGGAEFLGLPTSGFVNFVKDDTLSAALLSLIQNGQTEVVKGDPAGQIPFILFPST